jgi:hypothetical protein
MPTKYLPLEDHLVRHIKPRLILRDEITKAVIGIFPDAFALRDGERDLSVSWLEFFSGTKKEQLRQVMHHTELKLNAKHGFAVIRVGTFIETCEKEGAKVRIIHEPTEGNPSHSSVHRYPRDNDALTAVLANLASDDLSLVATLTSAGS